MTCEEKKTCQVFSLIVDDASALASYLYNTFNAPLWLNECSNVCLWSSHRLSQICLNAVIQCAVALGEDQEE